MSKYRWMLILPAAILIMLACNFTTPSSPPGTIDQSFLYTAAAGTLSVQFTQGALSSTGTALAQPPTSTVQPPTDTPSVTNTPTRTSTPVPSITPFPPTRTPSPTALPCLAIKFVKDVTIPDGTKFSPGTSFTKTWELQNAGSCTWTTDFDLVFVKGNQMSGDDRIPLEGDVKAGEKVQVSVDLVAPLSAGTYRGDWMLSNKDGDEFGLGSAGDKTFWVSIKVNEVDEGVVFSFADAYCAADWESSAGSLDCPGKGTEPSGFVVKLDRPDLENRREDEPTLWTNPEMADDGWITGTYPAFEVKKGDHFIADIGCLKDNKKCDVIFQVNYRIGDGSVKNLDEWHEVYDGDITRIDLNLSDLKGEEVSFILTVTVNDDYNEDAAFWLNPHIDR